MASAVEQKEMLYLSVSEKLAEGRTREAAVPFAAGAARLFVLQPQATASPSWRQEEMRPVEDGKLQKLCLKAGRSTRTDSNVEIW